jgi:hypothetical protein
MSIKWVPVFSTYIYENVQEQQKLHAKSGRKLDRLAHAYSVLRLRSAASDKSEDKL